MTQLDPIQAEPIPSFAGLLPEPAPFNVEALQAKLQDGPIPWNVKFAPVIDSTMNCHRYLLERNQRLAEGMVLVAGHQTGGVGGHGAWMASDRDLAFTMVLSDPTTLRENMFLGAAAALAMRDAVTEIVARHNKTTNIKVKLLNDLCDCSSIPAKKLCGVLAIGRFQEQYKERFSSQNGYELPDNHLLIGMGVNLTNHAMTCPDLRRPATSLESIIGNIVSREEVLASFLPRFAKLQQLIESRPENFPELLRPFLVREIDKELVFQCSNGKKEKMKLVDFAPNGIVGNFEGGGVGILRFDEIQSVQWILDTRRQ